MSTGGVNQADNHSPIILQSLEARLRLSASKGQIEEVDRLLREGATFQSDQDGRTALHYSAQNGYLETCKILIRNGCDTDCQDALGYTPLHRCIAQGNLEIAQLLLTEGCQVDVQDQNGNTPLHEAAWNGYSKSLELLVKHNCNVHIANKAGFTALHLASQAGHNESSRVLLYASCNSDSKNNYGDTALHTAARYGHAGVTRILISARCRLNEQNKNGDTALHITAALRRRKIAKLLVEAHIDANIKNKQNETAIDVARRKEHPEIILIITSFSRPKTPRHSSREREHYAPPQVAFKEEIEMIDGPVVVPEDQPALKSEKQEEKKRFFFFKRKKKDKEKEKPAQEKFQPVDPRRKVEGFFSQYVPKPGVQYYRDLAGNIKQGPVGYTPDCHCGPSLKKLESDMEKTKGNLYDHIDASHQILSERIDHLDQRTSQQVYAIDKLTRERLDQERQACHNRITQRIEEEWSGNRNVLSQYNQQIKTWLDDKMNSYGHCLNHHHDDSALPSRNIFFDFHENANGRLFKSRSDETLSDCSGKNRKKTFYESRQAAMRQIRGWKVPTQSEKKPKECNNNNTTSVTQAQVHHNKNNMDRHAEGASPKYEENANTTYHDFNYPGSVRKERQEGAIPKQHASHPHQWHRPCEGVNRPPSVRPYQTKQFDSQLYKSMTRSQIENRSSQTSNLGEGGVPNLRNNTGARDSSLVSPYGGAGAHNHLNVGKQYDVNRNYQTSAYNSRPLSPNYRLAKSSDLLNQDHEMFSSGIQRSKSVERTLDNPDRKEHCRSPQRKSVTFLDRVGNKTPTFLDANSEQQKTTNPLSASASPHRYYNSVSSFKQENPYSSVGEIHNRVNAETFNNRPYGSVSSCNQQPFYAQYASPNHNYNVRNTAPADITKPENSQSKEIHATLNGSKSPVQAPKNFVPYDHSSPSHVIYNPSYVNKEDSTCSSNPDSGYSSKGIGHGHQSVSGTPSSSFSADRSLSIGTPSNSNSPCLSTNQMDFIHAPNNTQISVQSSSASPSQSHSWYQRKLLEAAEKMRKTNQYNEYDSSNKSTYNDLYVTLNYDPVHGSDV